MKADRDDTLIVGWGTVGLGIGIGLISFLLWLKQVVEVKPSVVIDGSNSPNTS
jgi:hypothetical protein